MKQQDAQTGKIILIDKQVGGKGQCCFFRSLFSIDGTRFLIDIKVDSVKEQSRASISTWNNGAWREVYSLVPAEMNVNFNMGYGKEPINDLLFDAVTSRLTRVAREVCF